MLTVYTKVWCGYFNMAKAYLQKYDIAFEEINIDHDKQAREYMISEGHRTAPQIYQDGKLFVEGGADALVSLSEQEIRERTGDLGLDDLSL